MPKQEQEITVGRKILLAYLKGIEQNGETRPGWAIDMMEDLDRLAKLNPNQWIQHSVTATSLGMIQGIN